MTEFVINLLFLFCSNAASSTRVCSVPPFGCMNRAADTSAQYVNVDHGLLIYCLCHLARKAKPFQGCGFHYELAMVSSSFVQPFSSKTFIEQQAKRSLQNLNKAKCCLW